MIVVVFILIFVDRQNYSIQLFIVIVMLIFRMIFIEMIEIHKTIHMQ